MAATSMNDILHPDPTGRRRYSKFPDCPEDWSPEQASEIAAAEGIALTDDIWEVVRALQHYFATHDFPNMRELHDALDEHFHVKGGMKYLYTVLPGGPVAQGCRLAGLTPPAGSVDLSFGSVQ